MLFLRVMVALLAARAAVCAPVLPLEVYQQRRAELRKKVKDGVIVLFGRSDTDDLRAGFFQEPNFNYLTGWAEPEAVLLLSADTDVLFLPRRDSRKETYYGKKLEASDAKAPAITGVARVLPSEAFESEFLDQLKRAPKIYTLKDEEAAKKLAALAPMRTIESISMTLARMRMVKSTEELALIEKAVKASEDAHRTAWKHLQPGSYEYQLAATMTATWMSQGCARPAYAPIVGSGPNGTILHYSRNGRRMDSGELVVMDAAAECSDYTADITRTVPVSRKFSKRQREIYEVVLGAQKAAIAAVKPGMHFGRTGDKSLYRIAYDYINTHGKDLHGEPLGKYFTHGLAHHVGLEVHDAYDPETPLAENMVITIEPGVYIPEENIGVRIEDMVLVTKNGGKVLTSGLEREPGQLEKALAR